MQAQLGSKRNWTDSDDLCVMFTAAYNDEFYHALRDALHAEVDSWHAPAVLRARATASSLMATAWSSWSQSAETDALLSGFAILR